jgi:hypothetical protein
MPQPASKSKSAAPKPAVKIHKTPYAQLTLDWSFKRVFATPGHEPLLARLITTFLDGHLAAPIKTVTVLNTTYTAKTKKLRSAVFDLHCKDELGNYFVVEMQLAKQDYFFERLIFYASQCVTSLVKKGGMTPGVLARLPGFYPRPGGGNHRHRAAHRLRGLGPQADRLPQGPHLLCDASQVYKVAG